MKLIEFIKENENWKELLSQKPYCIKVKEYDGEEESFKKFTIFSYNQIDSDFSNPIVRECRGVILNMENLTVACRGFDKFMNYGESTADVLDWAAVKITEKVDGCLSKEVKVLTNKGEVPISEIVKDISKYKVLTFNHNNSQIEFSNIVEKSVKENINNWYEIELEDGTKIKLTGNHKVWVENLKCYRAVEDLDGTEELKKL